MSKLDKIDPLSVELQLRSTSPNKALISTKIYSYYSYFSIRTYVVEK